MSALPPWRPLLKRAGWLAGQAMRQHRAQGGLLALAFALAVYLPVALAWLDGGRGAAALARADASPWILGAAGVEADVALNSLYFQAPGVPGFPEEAARAATESGLATVVPVHARFGVRGQPIVGTHLATYGALRGWRPAAGRLTAEGFEAVVGARAAATQGLGLGDKFLPDATGERAASRPQLITVVGVLAGLDTPDDDAVFVPLATSWSLGGGRDELTAALLTPHSDAGGIRLKAQLQTRPGARVTSPGAVLRALHHEGPALGRRPPGTSRVAWLVSCLIAGLAVAALVWLRRDGARVWARLGASRLLVGLAIALEGLAWAGLGLAVAGVALLLLAAGPALPG